MKNLLVRIGSHLFPSFITSLAYNQFTKPRSIKTRENELSILSKSKKEIYKFRDFDIQLYTWKGGEKKILLIHGWEGQAGNFSHLIESLMENGYTVHSFDAPSHGNSSRGRTDLFNFSELVGVLIKKYGVKLLVSHSFGGVATTYALFNNPTIQIDKYVLITTPDKLIERIEDVSEMVGITSNIKNRLINRLEKEKGVAVDTINVSDFVKAVNVKKALIIHDKEDKIIPITRAKNVHKNWNISEFKEVEGTGHFRILRTKEIIDEVINYLD